jgi:hypothetical protein
MARKLRAPATIKNYLNGVRILHSLKCLDTDQFKHPTLDLLHKGIAGKKQHLPNQVLPISPDMLVEMRGFLDLTLPLDCTYWALLLLSFFLFTRNSNMLPKTIASFVSDKQLIRQDVLVQKDMLLVTIKWSKTIQFGQRQHVVPVLAIPGSPLCPVQAYKAMTSLVPASVSDPVFLKRSKSKWVPLSYSTFATKLKSLVAAIGREPAAYSSHSLRRGGASYMAAAGVERDMIKLVGDWASDAVDLYIQVGLPAKVRAAQKMRLKICQDLALK